MSIEDGKKTLLIHSIRLPLDEDISYAFEFAKRKLSRLGISTRNAAFSLYRKSVDARRRNDIHFVVSVAVSNLASFPTEQKCKQEGIGVLDDTALVFSHGIRPLTYAPVVVGSGPAGLFCALLLAENGFSPIILERGGTIGQRKDAVARFHKTKTLDSGTNIQFGAGGAGTFSDGKLVTRINDPLTGYILKRFVEFGAPSEILTMAKPHVGTDILSSVVEKMIERIVALGGQIRYNTTFLSFRSCGSRVTSAETTGGSIPTDLLILATGHSARDTYRELMSLGLALEAKPFSVGMRIEHRAADIDRAMYGDFVSHPKLSHAEYNLSANTKTRGVYTFCMCPGGEVVAATSEEGAVVVNGMSRHARDGINSNSAVVCSVFKDDYGATPIGALRFIEQIERKAFLAGGSTYATPLITVGDFLDGRDALSEPSRVLPTYMEDGYYKLAAPSLYLPDMVTDGIRRALYQFDKQIPGFAAGDAILSGAETRTSSPIRILRESASRLAMGYANLYPVGEGAGYAGGITSAAIDGVRCAIRIMAEYAPIL